MQFQKYVSTRATPQTQPIPGAGQVMNAAGGYAWAVDNWTRLDRFLVLGTEGGTFYTSERALTVQNAQAVAACIEGGWPAHGGAHRGDQRRPVVHPSMIRRSSPWRWRLRLATRRHAARR
jgi:hypothetical protein